MGHQELAGTENCVWWRIKTMLDVKPPSKQKIIAILIIIIIMRIVARVMAHNPCSLYVPQRTPCYPPRPLQIF